MGETAMTHVPMPPKLGPPPGLRVTAGAGLFVTLALAVSTAGVGPAAAAQGPVVSAIMKFPRSEGFSIT